jgi:hypothetical protein
VPISGWQLKLTLVTCIKKLNHCHLIIPPMLILQLAGHSIEIPAVAKTCSLNRYQQAGNFLWNHSSPEGETVLRAIASKQPQNWNKQNSEDFLRLLQNGNIFAQKDVSISFLTTKKNTRILTYNLD